MMCWRLGLGVFIRREGAGKTNPFLLPIVSGVILPKHRLAQYERLRTQVLCLLNWQQRSTANELGLVRGVLPDNQSSWSGIILWAKHNLCSPEVESHVRPR